MLDYKQKILVEKAARDAGFEISVGDEPAGSRFASSLVSGELAISVTDGGYLIQVRNRPVMEELATNFVPARKDCSLHGDAIFAAGTLALQDLAERIFQLSMALPSKPLDLFKSRVGHMPTSTEIERLVVQRVGQDIFREALESYWVGKCAVTGIVDRQLLRASHILPWSKCDTDDQRLDVFNGLLLVAHLDVAFDAALLSFDEDGRPMLSDALSDLAVNCLSGSLGDRPIPLTDRHQFYLRHHRARFSAGQDSDRTVPREIALLKRP